MLCTIKPITILNNNLKAMKLLFAFILILPQISFAQWSKTYGGVNLEYGFSIRETPDNGFIICGTTESFGNGQGDNWLIKINEFGDTLWTKTIGEATNEQGGQIRQTMDGGFILTSTVGIGPLSSRIVKTNVIGDTLWTLPFGGGGAETDVLLSVEQTTDNGFLFSGYTNSYGTMNGQADMWLIKTDNFGDTLWTKTYGGLNWESGKAIQTNDGGFLISAVTYSFSNLGQEWLIKTNNTGDTLWTKIYGGIWDEYINESIQTTDNGFAILGQTNSFGNGGSDVWFIKTDQAGDTLWTKTYGGSNDEIGVSVKQTSDGGYIIGAQTKSFGNGLNDLWIIKTDAFGDTLWTSVYGGASEDYIGDCHQTSDGGYIILGSTNSMGNGSQDIWVIKTDANGIASTQETFLSKKFTIYPNPVTDIISLTEIGNAGTIKSIEIITVDGRIVSNYEGVGTKKINVSKLTSGQYFLKVIFNNEIETVKFIKR
ncbi:MAG: hypothetical protein ACJA1C_001026 [Crocinitomicaceae bacterium]